MRLSPAAAVLLLGARPAVWPNVSASRSPACAICMAARRPRSADDLPQRPQKRRRKLSGSFLPLDSDPLAIELDDRREIVLEDNDLLSERNENSVNWSPRAITAQELWANETYKSRALAKRWQTLAHKGRGPRGDSPTAQRPLSAGGQRRSDAMKLRHKDEPAWMEKRLADGAAKRSTLNNEDYKKELQKKRSEQAAKSYAKRKKRIRTESEEGK